MPPSDNIYLKVLGPAKIVTGIHKLIEKYI